jgi:adenylosuccinate lyase
MREEGSETNDLLDRLAGDNRLGLSRAELEKLVQADPLKFSGLALDQTDMFIASARKLLAAHPDAAAYEPEPIL